MRRLEVRKYLFDIAKACSLLSRFTAGKTLAEYSNDPLLRSAVERQFEIIGEALRHAVDLDPELGGRVTHAGRIIGFRNRLIHGYATVSDEVVWGVLESALPTLRKEIEALLQEETDRDVL